MEKMPKTKKLNWSTLLLVIIFALLNIVFAFVFVAKSPHKNEDIKGELMPINFLWVLSIGVFFSLLLTFIHFILTCCFNRKDHTYSKARLIITGIIWMFILFASVGSFFILVGIILPVFNKAAGAAPFLFTYHMVVLVYFSVILIVIMQILAIIYIAQFCITRKKKQITADKA